MQSKTFDVTLTSSDDIPCGDELYVTVLFDDAAGGPHGAGPSFGCSTGEWFF